MTPSRLKTAKKMRKIEIEQRTEYKRLEKE